MSDLSPQDPYRSFVVSASAGSGKTFQLSRRFLNLVGAGADPQSILTITFTVKAAAEMRERILRDAGEMLRNADEAAAFDARLQTFFKHADTASRNAFGRALKQPRSAHEVAQAVLAGTQLLKIATIDSIFASWVRKFPWEAAGRAGVERAHFPILSGADRKDLHAAAWQTAARHLDESGLLPEIGDLTFLEVGRRLEALASHRSYLWYAAVLKERSGFLDHLCVGPSWENEAACLTALRSELHALVAAMPNAEKRAMAEAALAQGDLEGLRSAGLLTRDGTISGNTIKGEKKRGALAREIATVEEGILRYQDGAKLRRLNQITKCFRELHGVYHEARESGKLQLERGEFDDILRGVFHLFQSPDAAGARYLLHKQIRHVMLDEFQDTSSLQWAVFHNIAAEMLAGFGEAENVQPAPSVFLVGDEKQSIYGFREADPAVIKHASLDLSDHGVVTVPMSRSYRTTQTVLDVVNKTFAELMPEFPAHATATREDGGAVIPPCGAVWLSPIFQGESEEAARVAEAHGIARFIASAVGKFPVHERRDGQSTYRPLRAGDCAILYRNGTHAERYEEALRQVGFAVVAETGGGYFERPEIMDALALLTWLACPFDVRALTTVLKSPFFGVADADLLQALEMSKDQELDRARELLACLEEKYPEEVATLSAWRRDARCQPPHRLLNRALRRRADCLDDSANEQEARLMRANLDLLMERVVAFEASGDGDFIPLLEKLRALQAEEKMGGANVSADAVHLMTIHKAKGLEFPLVVLVDTASPWEREDPFWSKSYDPDNPGLYYVGTSEDRPRADPAFGKVRAALEREARSENERLLYVAMTRPSQYLLMTGYETRASKKALPPFYRHLENVVTALGAQSDEGAADGWRVLRDPPVALSDASYEDAPLAQTPAPERVTASSGVLILPPSRTLEQPDEGERPLVAVSAARRRFATEMGTLIHKGLEVATLGQEYDLEKFWERLVYPQSVLDEIAVRGFAEAMGELAEVKKDPNWIEMLANATAVHPEMPFIHLHGDQLVRGNIDLCVERQDGRILVIDYKTTAVGDVTSDALQALARDKGYFMQLSLYVSAMRALYPERTVLGAVYFTAARRSVWI